MNMKGLLQFILVSLQLMVSHAEENNTLTEFPIVNLPQGSVRGKMITRTNHEPYWVFLGIPFAKPPTGDLRFKAAQEAEPWNGTLDAMKEGSMCMQINDDGDAFIGDEDCLFINVYTTKLPEHHRHQKLQPVMVWIYGGGFMAGSGNYDFQGPEYLIDKGVVYVSFNYRLGVLGFLSTMDSAVPGNAGIKDQVHALRWVRKNIAQFGGDPNQVTIFGESSGAAGVSYHLLSPMSKGLFKKAIAESGSATIPWTPAVKPRETAFLISRSLGFSGNSSEELADFLRNVSAEELLNTSITVVPDRDKYRFTKLTYVPSIEVPVEGEEIFLPDTALHLFHTGKFHKVPYLTGVNSDEGILALLTGGILANWSRVQEIDENFDRIFKPELRLCKEDPCGDEILDRVKHFYFGNQSFTNDTLDNFIQFWTDLTFTEGLIYGIDNMVHHSRAPVYLYEFSYDGSLGFFKRAIGLGDFPGVCHGDELGYIFNISTVSPKTAKDAERRDMMTTMWTNFAKTGNPTPPFETSFPVWHPYTRYSRNYLSIGDRVVNKKNLHEMRIDFWQRIYAEYERLGKH